MNNKEIHIHQASQLLREQHSGVLASHSLSVKGYPFGSVTPFFMTEQGDVVIYASDIAQHSRNMQANSKVSLCVYNASNEDSQANARVTLLGKAKADAVDQALQNQYFTLFPQALAYVKAHDFRFYLITTERVRYIGGFGEIYWFSEQEWRESKIGLSNHATGAIEHMHQDHADALAEIVGAALDKNIKEGEVKMLTCLQHGFHYLVKCSNESQKTVNDTSGFIAFNQPISEDFSLRQAMVMLTHAARKPQVA